MIFVVCVVIVVVHFVSFVHANSLISIFLLFLRRFLRQFLLAYVVDNHNNDDDDDDAYMAMFIVANYKTKTNQVISLSFFLFLGFHSNFEYFSIDSFGIYLHDFNFFSFSRVLVFKITITLNNSMLNGI